MIASKQAAILRARLEALGWTPRVLARVSDIDEGTISHYLRGERTIGPANALRLAKALALDAGRLIYGEES